MCSQDHVRYLGFGTAARPTLPIVSKVGFSPTLSVAEHEGFNIGVRHFRWQNTIPILVRSFQADSAISAISASSSAHPRGSPRIPAFCASYFSLVTTLFLTGGNFHELGKLGGL
jgi:hypothetical protein